MPPAYTQIDIDEALIAFHNVFRVPLGALTGGGAAGHPNIDVDNAGDWPVYTWTSADGQTTRTWTDDDTNVIENPDGSYRIVGDNGDIIDIPSPTAAAQAAVDAVIDSAPAALNTLNELAEALGDDPNFAATITGLATAAQAKADANETAIAAIPAVLDEDDFATDSATQPPSQQSVKAYVAARHLDYLKTTGGAINPAIAATSAVGDVISTASYYEGSGLGGATYRVVAAGTGTNDGGSYIDVDASLQLQAVFDSGRFDASCFGFAVSATTNAAALNAAITFAAIGDYEIDLPPGVFNIEAGIGYLNRTRIIGTGFGATILEFTGTGKMWFNAEGARCYANRFEGFNCNDVGGSGTVGLDWDSVSASALVDVQLINFDIGVDINGETSLGLGNESASLYNRFDSLDARLGGTGILVRHQCNSNVFVNPRVLANSVGCRVEKANNINFHGGAFEANTSHGIDFTADPAVNTFNRMNSVHGVRFEGNPVPWETDANCLRTMFIGNFYTGGLPVDNSTTTQRFEVPMGYWGASGYSTQPAVTGSRDGNNALAVLLAVLDNYGLIDNQTTSA